MERETEIPSFLLDGVDTKVIGQAETIVEHFFKGKSFEKEAVTYMSNMLGMEDFDDLAILLSVACQWPYHRQISGRINGSIRFPA